MIRILTKLFAFTICAYPLCADDFNRPDVAYTHNGYSVQILEDLPTTIARLSGLAKRVLIPGKAPQKPVVRCPLESTPARLAIN